MEAVDVDEEKRGAGLRIAPGAFEPLTQVGQKQRAVGDAAGVVVHLQIGELRLGLASAVALDGNPEDVAEMLRGGDLVRLPRARGAAFEDHAAPGGAAHHERGVQHRLNPDLRQLPQPAGHFRGELVLRLRPQRAGCVGLAPPEPEVVGARRPRRPALEPVAIGAFPKADPVNGQRVQRGRGQGDEGALDGVAGAQDVGRCAREPHQLATQSGATATGGERGSAHARLLGAAVPQEYAHGPARSAVVRGSPPPTGPDNVTRVAGPLCAQAHLATRRRNLHGAFIFRELDR